MALCRAAHTTRSILLIASSSSSPPLSSSSSSEEAFLFSRPRSFRSLHLIPSATTDHRQSASLFSTWRTRRSLHNSTILMRSSNTIAEAMDPVQKRLMFEDECILVDENDKVVGHDSKYNCHLMENIDAGKALHRAFSVFLFNEKHELLLQKRSSTKVTFPLVWTNTCCSHPLYRESELIEDNFLGVKNAAQRKLYDELGIVAADAPVDDFTFLGRILYKAPSDGKWGEHELDYLLFLVRDVSLQPNPDEVADVMYVNKDQLKELLRKADASEGGVKLSPWFRLVVDNFLFDWWKKLEDNALASVANVNDIHKLC